jgi:hypothetical protein
VVCDVSDHVFERFADRFIHETEIRQREVVEIGDPIGRAGAAENARHGDFLAQAAFESDALLRPVARAALAASGETLSRRL